MTENKEQKVIELLKKAGKSLYGERWKSDLARDLGYKDLRRINQWMTGDRPIAASIKYDLARILEERCNEIKLLLEEIEKSEKDMLDIGVKAEDLDREYR